MFLPGTPLGPPLKSSLAREGLCHYFNVVKIPRPAKEMQITEQERERLSDSSFREEHGALKLQISRVKTFNEFVSRSRPQKERLERMGWWERQMRERLGAKEGGGKVVGGAK
jgi:hypothetical protein